MSKHLILISSFTLLLLCACTIETPYKNEIDEDARRGDMEAMANRDMGYNTDKKAAAEPEDTFDNVHWPSPGEYWEAEYQRGLGFLHGDPQAQNDAEAYNIFSSAVRNGRHVGAMYELARCYLNGVGTKKNLEEAYYWMSIAAAQEHPEAIRQMKIMDGYISQETKQKATQRADEYLGKNIQVPSGLPK